jgi:hypothetical protein
MNLAKLIIGTIKRLEGNQFRRIRREVRCVLLVLPLCRHMLNFVGGTVQFGSDEPWTGEGIDKFINLSAPSVGSGCATSKNGVADRINLRVGLSCVDEFPMISPLFVNKEGSNFPECGETSSEVTRIGGDSGGSRSEFQVLVG